MKSQNQKPKTKNQIPNPKSQIPNPKSQIPNPKSQTPILFRNLNSFPKRDVILDLLRLGLYLGVIPCGIGIRFAVDDDVVIARRSFPSAHRVRFTGLKELRPD